MFPFLKIQNLFTLVQLDEVPANGVQYADSSDQVTSSPLLRPGSVEKRGRTKEVAFDVGDSRRSSNSVCPAYESDSEDQQDTDLLDDISRIPRYQNTRCYLHSSLSFCKLVVGPESPLKVSHLQRCSLRARR